METTRCPEGGSETTDFPRIGINTQALLDEVRRLLKLASKEKDLGAVNWGDLDVADIEYRLSILHPNYGPTCVVMIEEASPECDLAAWLHKRIDKGKFPNTYFECSW